MALRLWLGIGKVFVAASTLAERITTVVKDHRTPPAGPPRAHP